MSPFSALACPNMHGPGIRVEVGNPKIGEFAVASTGCQGCADESSELGVTSVDQPLRFIDLQVPNPSSVSLFKRSDTPPGVIRGDLALAPSHIERSLEARQRPGRRS